MSFELYNELGRIAALRIYKGVINAIQQTGFTLRVSCHLYPEMTTQIHLIFLSKA
jgi:hypothetical protein